MAPNFTVDIYDINLDVKWYTINGGLTNHTFTTNGSIDQSDWTNHSDGVVNVIFYAKDLAGNIGTVSVTIIKNLPPSSPGIPGYNIYFLIAVISIVSVLLIRKRFKP